MEPEVNNEKPKFNWKRLLITLGIVIVTAGVIGGTVWYFMDKQAKEDKAAAEKTAQDLQKQIDDLNKKTTSTTASTATAATTDPMASWKTYSGNGFQFKYPSEGYNVTNGDYTRGILFTVSLRPNGQTAQPATPSTLTVSGYVKASPIALDNWIKTTDAVGLNYLNGLKAAKIGSLDGYTFLQSGMVNYTAYAVSKSDTAFVISTINPESAVFKNILSTFKLN